MELCVQLLRWNVWVVRGYSLAILNSKLVTAMVNVVFAHFTSIAKAILHPLSTHIAKRPFEFLSLAPSVGYGLLHQHWRYACAGSCDIRHTLLVCDKVTHFAGFTRHPDMLSAIVTNTARSKVFLVVDMAAGVICGGSIGHGVIQGRLSCCPKQFLKTSYPPHLCFNQGKSLRSASKLQYKQTLDLEYYFFSYS